MSCHSQASSWIDSWNEKRGNEGHYLLGHVYHGQTRSCVLRRPDYQQDDSIISIMSSGIVFYHVVHRLCRITVGQTCQRVQPTGKALTFKLDSSAHCNLTWYTVCTSLQPGRWMIAEHELEKNWTIIGLGENIWSPGTSPCKQERLLWNN